MPQLTERQKEKRAEMLQSAAEMLTGSACPCCNRPFTLGNEGAEKMIKANLAAFNALVAALYPDNPPPQP